VEGGKVIELTKESLWGEREVVLEQASEIIES
jgi:hypothetical protein